MSTIQRDYFKQLFLIHTVWTVLFMFMLRPHFTFCEATHCA